MTDYERDLAAGGEPVQSDYERDLAAGGVPAEAPATGGRPTGFFDRLKFAAQHPIDSLRDEIPRAYEGAQAAADNMLNAASLGAYRQLRDARSVPEALMNTAPASARTRETARFNEAHPVVAAGSELAGSLVGAPEMAVRAGGAALKPVVKAVDSAIGRKALELATRPAAAPGPVAKFVKKAAERTIHGAIGHSVGGLPGLVTSQVLSPLAHDATAAIGNRVAGVGRRAVGGLAERYLGQAAPALAEDSGLLVHEAAAGPPRPQRLLGPMPIELGPITPPVADVPADLADILAQTEPAAARAPLAPLAPEPLPPAQMPPGAFGAPMFDEFGMPLTTAGPPAANHATVGGGTVTNGLRADVVRDAAAARAEPMPAPGPPTVEDTLGVDLAKSVRLLDELRAGKITAKQAIDAGLPSGIVAKVLH